MHGYYLFSILIASATFLIYINYKLIKLPVTIAITLFSLFLSIALMISHNAFPRLNEIVKSNIDEIHFNEIVMDILLGFLLFAAAFKMELASFKKHLGVIFTLAFLGTLFSTFIVGGLVYYSFILLHNEVPFINCLLFGALISPTDPIAAVAVLSRVGISKKLELQITGESLINDGFAIVIFTTLLGLAANDGKAQPLSQSALLFLKEAGGALLFGGVLGGIVRVLLRSVNNFKLEILITLSIVSCGYTMARLIDVSAPISMVVTGLICNVGKTGKDSSISHEFVYTFWELAEDMINAILFLLIGVSVFVIPLNKNILIIGSITVVLILIARYISLLPVYVIFHKQLEKHTIKLFTWAALRGAVSIAMALSLPSTLHRAEFLAITYFIAVFSIIVQGLTIRPFAQKLGLGVK